MPLMTEVTVVVTYDGSEAAFFVNGGLSNKEKILLVRLFTELES